MNIISIPIFLASNVAIFATTTSLYIAKELTMFCALCLIKQISKLI